ncbi:MAG: hypothetical protein QM758_09255 [Armatimonas sp.]
MPLLQIPKPPPPPGIVAAQNWDVARKGSFIAVLPFRTVRTRLEKVGTVTAMVPEQRLDFTGRPTGPRIPQGRYQIARAFTYSLRDEQLRQLLSEQGLGRESLDGRQTALFNSLFPASLIYGPEVGPRPDIPPKDSPLTPEQYAGLRLRVFQRAGMSILSDRGPAQGLPSSDKPEIAVKREQEPDVTLFRTVPNRLKSGELDFQAPELEVPVPLEGAKTVEDLLEQIKTTTGVSVLRADRRVLRSPVVTVGSTARAGDLLKALCLSVSGAFRKVGELYLLTDDVVGLGTRYTLLEQWRQEGFAEANREEDAFVKRRTALKLSERVFVENTVGLSPKALEFARSNPTHELGRSIPGLSSTELSQKTRTRLEDYVLEHPTGKIYDLNPPPTVALRSDRFLPTLGNHAQLLIPDVGGVSSNNALNIAGAVLGFFPSLSSLSKEKLSLPVAWTERALQLPAEPEFMEHLPELLQAAKHAGLKALWLRVDPEASKSTPLLQQAHKACQEAGMVLVADIEPLHVVDSKSFEPDWNILGETSLEQVQHQEKLVGGPPPLWEHTHTWIVPTPAAQMVVRREIAQIAALPEVSAVALNSVHPQGYGVFGSSIPGSSFGYTLQNRLALIESEQLDPIDIGQAPFQGVRPLFFSIMYPKAPKPEDVGKPRPPEPEPDALWRKLLKEQIAPFQAALLKDLAVKKVWLKPEVMQRGYSLTTPTTKAHLEELALTEQGVFSYWVQEVLRRPTPSQGFVLTIYNATPEQVLAGLKRFMEQQQK